MSCVDVAACSNMWYLQVLWAHVWGIAFLGEHETLTGIAGSALLAGGVVAVSSSKAKAPEPGPDETTAFVTSMESKAADYEDTRVTLGDGVIPEEDEWHKLPEKGESDEIEMTSEVRS